MGPTEGGTDDRGSMFLPGMEEAAAEDQAKRSTEETGTHNSSMSAETNHLNLTNAGAPPVALTAPSNGTPHSTGHTPDTAAPGTPPDDYVEPLWMRRSKLVVFVMACIYLGIILVILPWNDVWTQNGLIHRYPTLAGIAMNNFVRGGITGLGFVNIWLGIWEAVSYREHRR